jgi:hypothetical protein
VPVVVATWPASHVRRSGEVTGSRLVATSDVQKQNAAGTFQPKQGGCDDQTDSDADSHDRSTAHEQRVTDDRIIFECRRKKMTRPLPKRRTGRLEPSGLESFSLGTVAPLRGGSHLA